LSSTSKNRFLKNSRHHHHGHHGHHGHHNQSYYNPFGFSLPVIQFNSNFRKLKDTGDQRIIPTLENALIASNVDHINQKKISQQKYLSTDVFLSKNVPNYDMTTASNLNLKPNRNIYELGGQTVKLTNNRPYRGVSNFGINSGGNMVKINQDKMISGATLKSRGVH
jgi:hypothetical protein